MDSPSPGLSPKGRGIIVLLTLLLTSCGNIPTPYESTFYSGSDVAAETSGTASIRFIDVGQGDATLITTPNGKSILIDAGTAEMGRERVLPIVADTDLELIIASHYDSDHIGGIPEVIKGPDGIINTADDIVPAMGVLDHGDINSVDSAHLADYFIITNDFRYFMNVGDEFEIDDVKFTIIGQNGCFMNGVCEDIDSENENAHSISTLIEHGDVSYLTLGDLPGPNFPNQYEPYDLEKHVAEIVGDIDILHVSHHGSHNSTNKKFLEITRPETAIISVGENDYGHPHQIVIDNLNEIGAEIFLTESEVSIQSDGKYRVRF